MAIDCEMGRDGDGDAVLLRVSAVDYLTDAVLINALVAPAPGVRVENYCTALSGVHHSDIVRARDKGTLLPGPAGARAALWRFVGPSTVVVGHGANSDLSVLRWIHARVVDSFILEARVRRAAEAAAAKLRMKTARWGKQQLSLQKLAQLRLGRPIQNRGKRRGHDCVGDARASADIVHLHVLRSMHGEELPVYSTRG